jgi:hypothetical protein
VKKHTQIYMKYFGYHLSDWLPCEICGCQAVDIHHIECRSMGGTKTKDTIENLMALCRGHHIQFPMLENVWCSGQVDASPLCSVVPFDLYLHLGAISQSPKQRPYLIGLL